jgi:hypothetical protein
MTARSSRKADRTCLVDFATALNVSRRRLKRDTCDDWIISARRGHFSTDGLSFYIYLKLKTPRRWEFAKQTLQFLTVSQDGDNEGIFIIRDIPTTEQAAVIRKVLGLRKAPNLTEKQRQTIRSRLNLPRRNDYESHGFIYDLTVTGTLPAVEHENVKKLSECRALDKSEQIIPAADCLAKGIEL